MRKTRYFFITVNTTLLLFLSIYCVASSNLSAEEIMLRVDSRYTGDTRDQLGILILVDSEKNKRVRRFREVSKNYGVDEKTISHVLSPAEVRGTAFMSYEWEDRNRDDESWLYLPQIKKVKRMAATDKSSYFLGSEFTYADIIGLEVEDFDYSFVVEREGENQFWIIDAVPKADIKEKVIDETGYQKVKYWINKTTFIIEKAQYWLNEGKKIKYMKASNIEKINDIWTVKKMQMVLTQSGKMLRASIYQIEDVTYNQNVEDEAFTTYAMEKENI